MNISVPDDLAEQVRTLNIPISETCQRALRKAVETSSKDEIHAGLDAVVDRLRMTISENERSEHQAGRLDGISWAREYATAKELQYLATEFGWGDELVLDTQHGGHSLLDFQSARDGQAIISITIDPENSYWDGFGDGVGEVWDAVADRL